MVRRDVTDNVGARLTNHREVVALESVADGAIPKTIRFFLESLHFNATLADLAAVDAAACCGAVRFCLVVPDLSSQAVSSFQLHFIHFKTLRRSLWLDTKLSAATVVSQT